jgi:hypothetical protein
MTYKSDWTDAETELVQKHYGTMPVRELAAMLGRNKNQVIGKAGRLKLCKKKQITPGTVLKRKPRPKISVAPVANHVPAIKFVPIAMAVPVVATSKPVTFEHRTGCCFPTNFGGPFLFCNNPGKQKGESIYCDDHWKIMYDRPSQHHGKAVITAHRTTYR